jgi:predicted small secreted protein
MARTRAGAIAVVLAAVFALTACTDVVRGVGLAAAPASPTPAVASSHPSPLASPPTPSSTTAAAPSRALLTAADLPAGWADTGLQLDLGTIWPDDKTIGPCVDATDLTARRTAFSGSAFSTGSLAIVSSYVTQYQSDADASLYLVRFSSPKLKDCLDTTLRAAVPQSSTIVTTVVIGPGAGGPANEAARIDVVVSFTTNGVAQTSTITQVYLKAARTVGWLQFSRNSVTPIEPALQQNLINLFATRLATA